MCSASIDAEYSVHPSYIGIKSELYHRTFMVLFLKFFYILFSVFYPILFPEFLEKDFWNFLPKAWKIPSGLFRKSVSRRF